MNYYYADANNKAIGPVPEDRLHTLASSGVITPTTYVWPEGETGRQYQTIALPSGTKSSGAKKSVSIVRIIILMASVFMMLVLVVGVVSVLPELPGLLTRMSPGLTTAKLQMALDQKFGPGSTRIIGGIIEDKNTAAAEIQMDGIRGHRGVILHHRANASMVRYNDGRWVLVQIYVPGADTVFPDLNIRL